MMKNSADYKIKRTPLLLKPYFYSKPSISAISIKMLILLSVQVVCLFLTHSFMAIGVILCATIAAGLGGLILYFFRKTQPFTIISIVVQGMLIGFLLPETFPLHTVFILTFVIVIFEQYIFVNCVNCWINIVCLVVVLGWFIGKQFFPDFLITSDLLSVKNPSLYLIQNGAIPLKSFDTAVTDFLNNSVFGWFDISLPNGLISLLCDNGSIIPAFRFNLVTIISSIFIFGDGSFSKTISFTFICVYVILVRMFCPLIMGGAFNEGDISLALYSSGTLFIAVFLLQWYGTHPITYVGKLVYGIIAGITAFVIVGCGTSPIGMCYTVLICNIINLFIREIEEYVNDKSIDKIITNAEVNKG